jgi:hypothetical protein
MLSVKTTVELNDHHRPNVLLTSVNGYEKAETNKYWRLLLR